MISFTWGLYKRCENNSNFSKTWRICTKKGGRKIHQHTNKESNPCQSFEKVCSFYCFKVHIDYYDTLVVVFFHYCSTYCFPEALETIQDNIDTFEDVGASEAEADFLQDFFDEPALGALLEVIVAAREKVNFKSSSQNKGKSEIRMTASILKQDPNTFYKRFRITLFIRTKHNMQIFGVIPFIKL